MLKKSVLFILRIVLTSERVKRYKFGDFSIKEGFRGLNFSVSSFVFNFLVLLGSFTLFQENIIYGVIFTRVKYLIPVLYSPKRGKKKV